MTLKGKNQEDLENLIDQAMKKIHGEKESDIGKFLPMEEGGYMHHFTLRRMKHKQPEKLKEMIKKFVTSPAKPKQVPHKPRRPRGSRKRHDIIPLTRSELNKLLQHARESGDQEIAAKLSPRRSLAQLKKQLTASIRRNTVDLELWSAYVDAIQFQQDPKEGYSASQVLLSAIPTT